VLTLFFDLDNRFFPITDSDRERAYDDYVSFGWDLGSSFFVNWTTMEGLVREMKRNGVDDCIAIGRLYISVQVCSKDFGPL